MEKYFAINILKCVLLFLTNLFIVEHTREGALDMRMINKLSLLAQKKVEAVKTDFRTFDVNDFVTRVVRKISISICSGKNHKKLTIRFCLVVGQISINEHRFKQGRRRI